MDLPTLCAVAITVVSLLTVPIQMVRHLRMDLEDKLDAGEKKFDRIVEQLDKCSDRMAECHADYKAVDAKLTMLINKGG